MISFDWKVTSFTTTDAPLPGTAVFATFNVIGTDDATGVRFTESLAVDLLPADPASFIALADLTAEQRAEFVKDALRVPGKDAPEVIEARIAERLELDAPVATHTFE